ncbi:restriction endonuclease subunit S [Rubrivivax sp. JA1026]|uniref:restriction endonuclease subunit S n=1 Tax=Rubrivivax sp. JA1026 TaxID=2710888 RepID=UPI0013E985B2|nr:restriction endonuclease subunit S [Rubrivivax sp. JA1026]
MTPTFLKLGDVVDVLSGFAFKSEFFNDSDGLPVVRIRDVVRGYTDTYYTGPYTEQFVVRDGDILIGMDGNFNAAKWRGGRALLNQRVCKVTARTSLVDEAYLFHYLPIALRRIEDATPFVTVKHLSAGDLREERIPIPPLAEQRRIAAILDKADVLRTKRREALAELDRLVQSIFVEMFGEPLSNPKGWPQRMLKELGAVSTGGTPPSAKEGMFGGDIPFVTPGDLESGQAVKRWLSEAGAQQVGTVRAGAALVCCIGTIGKVSMASTRSAFNQQLNAVEWRRDLIDDRFGLAVLRFFKATMAALGASTTVPILKKSSFEKLSIPVPPRSLQMEFSRRLSEVEKLQQTQHKALQANATLFESLQHRAFQGDL